MIKKLALVVFLGLSMACNKENNKNEENQEFLDALIGRYELRVAYLQSPIDLNGDGTVGIDLFEEVEYCNMSKQLESYWCTIVDANIQSLNFDIPYSDHFNNFQDYSNCIRHKGVFRELSIDSLNENVVLVSNDYEENFMLQFQAVLIDFVWQDRVIYLTLEKEFYTPNGEWVDAVLYMEYEWVSGQI